MKKILLISHSSEATGGGEDDFERLLTYLYSKYTLYGVFPEGERINVFSSYFDDYLIIKSNIFPFSKLAKPVTYFNFIRLSIMNNRKIRKFIQNKSINLGYLHSSVCFLQTYPLKKLNVPVIVSVKEKINPNLFCKIIFSYLNRNTCKFIFISKYLVNAIGKFVDFEKIHLVYSCIESQIVNKVQNQSAEITPSLDIETFKIVNIGVIAPYKGQHILIEAIKNISFENFSVNFIGRITNSYYYNSLKNNIAQNNLNDKIHFLGSLNRESVYAKILEADCVIISSLEEGQSLVVLEALMLSKPVIASSVGIIPEVIQHDYNGLIYKPGDYLQLAKLIDNLAKCSDLQEKISSNAKKSVDERFNLELNLVKYEEIFRSCML